MIPSLKILHSSFDPASKEDFFYSRYMKKIAESPRKELAIGLVGGFLEVGIDQPLVSIKNIFQKQMNGTSGRWSSISAALSFRQLYGGSMANALGTSLLIGIQMESFSKMQKFLSKGKDPSTLSNMQNLFASTVGGIAASPAASWSEMLMDKFRENIHAYEKNGKQGKKPTYPAAMSELKKLFGKGVFMRGMAPTIGREIGFTAAYTTGGPYFTEAINRDQHFKSIVPEKFRFLASNILGGLIAGVLGAAATHPFDTWKTLYQAGMKVDFWPEGIMSILRKSLAIKPARQSIIYLVKNLTAEPYKGFSPRCIRVAAAVAFLTSFNASAENYLKKFNSVNTAS